MLRAQSAALPLRPVVPSLVSAAQEGDAEALDQLLRDHWIAIERLCRRMCPTEDSFEDLRQDVFIALIRALPSYRGQAAFLTWAYTVVRTCRGRRLRKQQLPMDESSELTEVAEPPTSSALDDRMASRQLLERIELALGFLSELDRHVLVLRDFEGYSANEVSAITGLTVPAVKTRLHRARVATRERLGARA